MKILFFANTDWYLYNFRLALAKALRSDGVEVVMLSPPGNYGKKLEAEGFRWVQVPMQRSINPAHEFRALLFLMRLFRQERADIVHHFTIKCVLLGGMAAIFAMIPATVNAIAGMGYIFANKSTKAKLLRPIVSVLLKWVLNRNHSCLILQNNDDKQEILNAGLIDTSRIFLIRGSGVDTQNFQPDTEKVFKHKATTVLLAARLLVEKGIKEYVESARILTSRGNSIRFLLAGEPDTGNPSAIAQDELNDWKHERIIEYLGQIDDMPGLYSKVDVVVLPSYYREGLPKSLLEAASCGIPLVATDAPGCREIVIHEVTGLRIPARDSVALADAIQRLCENPEWAAELGQAARQKVLAEFDQHLVIDQTLAVYDKLLAGKA